MNVEHVENSLKQVSEKLAAIAKERGVTGEPIAMGDTTVLPLCEIRMAFGVGGGEGEGESLDPKGAPAPEGSGKGRATGGGGGGGLAVKPVALLVVSGNDIWLEPLSDRGGV